MASQQHKKLVSQKAPPGFQPHRQKKCLKQSNGPSA
jgi:hypothetical protein